MTQIGPATKRCVQSPNDARSTRAANRRNRYEFAEARADRGLDAGGVEARFGQQFLAAGMFEVAVGEAEMQDLEAYLRSL